MAFVISGANDMVFNDENNKDRISISEQEIDISAEQMTIPKESAGIYKFRTRKK